MLRVPLSLAVLLSALFALAAVAEAAETWEPADKQAFGTAHDVRSKVWFTLGPTGMGEAYWPRIDRPAVRSLDLKVGGSSEAAKVSSGQGHEVLLEVARVRCHLVLKRVKLGVCDAFGQPDRLC